MKNKIFFAAVLCFQILFSQRLSHPVRAEAGTLLNSFSKSSFPDTLNVLAILVQFQQDNDSRTSGNGLFDLTVSDERIVDAPPHDSAYVANHFVFAQNYFSKASNGKQNVTTTVLGKTITLKKQMKDYAPINGNLPLVQMIEEAWKTADSLYPGFSFQQYDMFAVFHAGVGKDIDLRAALGYDPTPLDIPSLYFNLNSFKSALGDPLYQGVSLPNSSFKIPNSVVLPETEVRRIPSVGGDFVLKLGINGLLVASIASHLGLPDLFDTKTGRTGIGRFGLMDGQSIFSFSGICPPEPSAWEKIYLGWIEPVTYIQNTTMMLPAVSLNEIFDSAHKVNISAKEYFLFENRQRDAKQNGQTVKMIWNGQIIEKTFVQDEVYFSNTNIDSVYGVVLDVDELDWSLPGLINDYNNYKGGILIWHIDETVIAKNIVTNSINADPNKRGVDLEEADGSQDIGQTYDLGDPASGSEDGSPIDYWFEGNIFPSYKNEFSENTNPNTLSNSLAKSHVTVKNFSLPGPVMSMDVRMEDENIHLAKIFRRGSVKRNNNDTPLAVDINDDGNSELLFSSDDSLFAINNTLLPYITSGFPNYARSGGRFQPAPSRKFDPNSSNDSTIIWTVRDSLLIGYSSRNVNIDDEVDAVFVRPLPAKISTPVVSYNFQNSPTQGSVLFAGDSTGYLNEISFWGTQRYKISSSPVVMISITPDKFWIAAAEDSIRNSLGGNIGVTGKKIIHCSLLQTNSSGSDSLQYVVLFDNNTITTFSASSLQTISTFTVDKTVTGSFCFFDANQDGRMDVCVGTKGGLSVYSLNGVLVENFPLTVFDKGEIIGSPIVVKLTGSNESAILFGSSNGQLYAYTSKGKMINGFPLQTGGIVSSPVLWGDKLVVASSDTSIYVWKTGNLFDTSRILWGNFLADNYHSNFAKDAATITQKSSELLPKKFAYNWPNPVYSGSTNIRYFLGKSATVRIKIVNLAGELVDELQGTNYAGLDNEVQWNITNIQSGIYFAQITANGSGEEASQIIKIAVVK